MQPLQALKNPALTILTVAATAGTIFSFRQPLMPVFAATGAWSGSQVFSSVEGSKSRRKRKLEAEQLRIQQEREALDKEAERVKREAEQSALVSVDSHVQLVNAQLQQKAQLIEDANTSINIRDEQINQQAELLNQGWDSLQQEAQRLQQWAEEQRKRAESIAARTLMENHSLKQPDLPEGATYEDMVAREICSILYTRGVIVKKPFVRPFAGGFELRFTILPVMPDLQNKGKTEHFVSSLGEAYRRLEEKETLADIQSKIYACDKVPTVEMAYEGLKLTCYLNHFQGQYPVGTGEVVEQPIRALISEHGLAGAIANEIIDHFFSCGIRADFVGACSFTDSQAMCWLKPEFKGKTAKVVEVLNTFASQLNSRMKLDVEWDDEYLSIFWGAETPEEFVKVKDKDGKEITIEEPEDAHWFKDVVLDPKSSHHLIHGPTGTGKSVLVDNICCVAGDDLAARTGKQVRINICDPKYPDSEWTYKGKRIRPQYRQWEGALEGVLAMNEEVNDRLAIAAEAADSVPDELFADPDYVLPLPERDIEIWAVDEAAALHERHEKSVGPAFRETAWVARSALVKMILIGQNPNCSNYGLQIPDLSNFVRWYLGITGLEALDKVIKPPRDIKARLKAQIYARLRLVKQLKRQGIKNPKEQYFALIWMNNEEPFVAQLPAPKAYADGSAVGSAIIAPQPDSLLDLVEQGLKENTPSPEAEQLNRLFENNEAYLEQRIANLPNHLKDIVECSKDRNDWVSARDFQRFHDRYSKVNPELIRDWFQELAAMEIGFVGSPKRSLCYRFSPISDNPDKTGVNDES